MRHAVTSSPTASQATKTQCCPQASSQDPTCAAAETFHVWSLDSVTGNLHTLSPSRRASSLKAPDSRTDSYLDGCIQPSTEPPSPCVPRPAPRGFTGRELWRWAWHRTSTVCDARHQCLGQEVFPLATWLGTHQQSHAAHMQIHPFPLHFAGVASVLLPHQAVLSQQNAS